MACGLVVASGLTVASGLAGHYKPAGHYTLAGHYRPAGHKGPRVLIYVSRSAWAFCIMAQVFIMAGCYVWFPVDGRLLARRLFPGVAA